MANNPVIGHWKKQPYEELRYEVDWSKWLIPGEILTAATVFVVKNTDQSVLELTDPFFVDTLMGVIFFVRGGLSGSEYQVTHRVTTSSGQIAEREIMYRIQEV